MEDSTFRVTLTPITGGHDAHVNFGGPDHRTAVIHGVAGYIVSEVVDVAQFIDDLLDQVDRVSINGYERVK